MFSRSPTGTPVPGRAPSRATSRAANLPGNQHRHPSVSLQANLNLLHTESDRNRDRAASVFNAGQARVFSHSEQLTIAFAGNVPVEVRQLLAAADLYGDQFTGTVDSITGYAFVVSPHTIFVWLPPKPTSRAAITCYMFPAPGTSRGSSIRIHLSLPVASLVYYGPMREPGLMLISKTGELRFWESIGVGLSGAEGFTTTKLTLLPEEEILELQHCDHLLYVATTSAGRVFRLAVVASGHVFATPFRAPPPAGNSTQSGGQRIWSRLFASGPTLSRIVTVTLGPRSSTRGSQQLWVLTADAVLRYHVSVDEVEQCDLHMELIQWLGDKWMANYSEEQPLVDLELLDIAVSEDGSVTILVSHEGPGGLHPRRLYELVELRDIAGTLEWISTRGISYEPSRPAHTPRMFLVQGGAAAIVHFNDALVLSFRDSTYQELSRLRNPGDRVFAANVVSAGSSGKDVRVLLNNMLLAVTVGTAPKQDLDDDDMGAGLLRAVMLRSIIYGPVQDNPLSFRFPDNVDAGNLMAASEQLSGMVLASDPTVVKPAVDLTTQLEDRMSRLSFLIHFINDNGVQYKLLKSSRRQLLFDANNCMQRSNSGCISIPLGTDIFTYTERVLTLRSKNDATEHHDVFVQAIEAYMSESGGEFSGSDDAVRSFFKFAVDRLPALLAVLAAMARAATQTYQNARSIPSIVAEADAIALHVIEAGHAFRANFLALYGLATELQKSESWTSTETVIVALKSLFEDTDKLLQATGESTGKNQEHFCALANNLLLVCTERLEWLKWACQEGAGREREHALLHEQFKVLRPQVLRTLVNRGFVENAFELAEQYRDYRMLTELCHEHVPEPSTRYDIYIERYQEVYAFDLYSYWIERGMGPSLFQDAEKHPKLVDLFFKQNDAARLKWIHDLSYRRYQDAARGLRYCVTDEPLIANRQLMLSLAKLAALAEVQPGERANPEQTKTYEVGLDFVAIQTSLVENFQKQVSTAGKAHIEHTVDEIVAAYGSKLEVSRPMSFKLFRGNVRSLMQGQALDAEDILDVITMKDNSQEVNRYGEALRLLASCVELPEARRRLCTLNIWRRVLLHDDWHPFQHTARLTDEQLIRRMQETALYQTLREAANHESITMDLQPDVSLILQPPLKSDVAARWPGFTSQERDLLMEDFAWECSQLRAFNIPDLWKMVAQREYQERSDSSQDLYD
ncbi:Non-repetitive/WGA-negative nucleoporin C-terminal-domain-containing protein [Auriculariales sp. MPI-PUGE-AT-0066]|nr:Non-repetitive/WGA-negative nucleoporin C-terminal-domain-containing protein [Auriculariales sp. MPI-PUGE-AT-0066]